MSTSLDLSKLSLMDALDLAKLIEMEACHRYQMFASQLGRTGGYDAVWGRRVVNLRQELCVLAGGHVGGLSKPVALVPSVESVSLCPRPWPSDAVCVGHGPSGTKLLSSDGCSSIAAQRHRKGAGGVPSVRPERGSRPQTPVRKCGQPAENVPSLETAA